MDEIFQGETISPVAHCAYCMYWCHFFQSWPLPVDENMRICRIVGTLLSFLAVVWSPLGGVDSRPIVLKTNRPKQLLPIIFVPGTGGSQIEARVNRTGISDQGLPECAKNLDWYRIWMDVWTFYRR